MRVVVVEDETMVARGLVRCVNAVLKESLQQLDVFADLDSAGLFLQANAVDVLLLDLNVQGRDGFMLLQQAMSGAFDLVVIDALAGLDGRLGTSGKAPRTKTDGALVVRKLALACEEKGTTCLGLTNAYESRPTPWPVALRIEVERRPEAIAVRVTKDRRGRTAPLHVVRVAC